MTRPIALAITVAFVGLLSPAQGIIAASAPGPETEASVGLPRGGDDVAARCLGLSGRQLGGATIDKTEFVPGGSALSPIMAKNGPEFCRVLARISPVRGSE